MEVPIDVFKDRTTKLLVSLGYDVSQDQLKSEIRAEPDKASTKLVEWQIEFVTDGVDGELVFTIDNSEVVSVTRSHGYMDIKRISAGEPLPVIAVPLFVRFVNSITV